MIIKPKGAPSVNVCDVGAGKCFSHTKHGEAWYYMVLHDSTFVDVPSGHVGVVCLEMGTVGVFQNTDQVQAVNLEAVEK